MPELLYRTTHGQMEHLANKTYYNKTNYNKTITINYIKRITITSLMLTSRFIKCFHGFTVDFESNVLLRKV